MRHLLDKITQGDCLEVMQQIQPESIDMILCDLPYGLTYARWDSVIPMPALWEAYRRIAKPNCPIVLTSRQPFTSLLVCSNLKEFRYEWIWDKVNAGNFANANRAPLNQHESVIVFSKESTAYYPVKTPGAVNHAQGRSTSNKSETRIINKRVADDSSGLKFPKTILCFPKHSSQCKFHSTQKPLGLFEYLIKTYSLTGQTVLDNCIGSGTTAVAAANLDRHFIGIEKEAKYCVIARKRLKDAERERQTKSRTMV